MRLYWVRYRSTILSAKRQNRGILNLFHLHPIALWRLRRATLSNKPKIASSWYNNNLLIDFIQILEISQVVFVVLNSQVQTLKQMRTAGSLYSFCAAINRSLTAPSWQLPPWYQFIAPRDREQTATPTDNKCCPSKHNDRSVYSHIIRSSLATVRCAETGAPMTTANNCRR